MAEGWIDREFIARGTAGFAEAGRTRRRTWERLERGSGATRAEMRRFAGCSRRAQRHLRLVHGPHPARPRRAPSRPSSTWASRGAGSGARRSGSCRSAATPACRAGPRSGCAPGLEEPQSTRFAEVWGFPCPSFKGLTAGDGGRGLPRRPRRVLDRGRQLPGDAARPRRGRARPRPRGHAHPPGHRADVDDAARPRRHRGPVPRHHALRVARAAAPRPRPSAASSSRPR